MQIPKHPHSVVFQYFMCSPKRFPASSAPNRTRKKSVKLKMAPFIGFGWGWGDPRTETVTEIDFLLTDNSLQTHGAGIYNHLRIILQRAEQKWNTSPSRRLLWHHRRGGRSGVAVAWLFMRVLNFYLSPSILRLSKLCLA